MERKVFRFFLNIPRLVAEGLVELPNYEGMREVDIPVENPGLVRWMLPF